MNDEDVKLRDFQQGDLAKVDPNSSLIGKEDMLRSYNSLFTFEHEGNPIACAGLVQLWPGTAEAWTVLGASARANPIWFVKRLKKELHNQIVQLRLHRVQMHVEDTPELKHWAEVLGFHLEGTMERYTQDRKTLHVYGYLV